MSKLNLSDEDKKEIKEWFEILMRVIIWLAIILITIGALNLLNIK